VRDAPLILLPDSHPSFEIPMLASARVLKTLHLGGTTLASVRESVLRNFTRGKPPDHRGVEPIGVQLILTPDEAARGGLTLVSVPTYYPCPVCRGSGKDDGAPCQVCGETGAIEETETVRIPIPPMVGDLDLFDSPLRGLGVHNYYLRLLVRLSCDT
jgi:hypothetical protein